MMRRRVTTTLVAGAMFSASAPAIQQTTFRAAVELVSVPVSVTDRNRPVPDLTTMDFELYDNGVRQEIALTTVDQMPTDVTLVVDVSGSLTGAALERIMVDAQEMSDLLQPNDRVRLVSFARDARDVFGWLPGGATLDFARMSPGGTTSLYDALVTVLAAQTGGDRPQLVFVVTDGRDNSSLTSAADVVEVARASGAVLCIALVQSSNPLVREGGRVDAVDPLVSEQSTIRLPESRGGNIVAGSSVSRPGGVAAAPNAISRSVGPYTGGPNRVSLDDAAATTGGLVYSDRTRTPIPQLFRRALDDFRASYLLSYRPAGVERGGRHTITVRVPNRRYTVRARRVWG